MTRSFFVPSLIAVCGLASCHRVSERMEITETREISEHARPVKTGVSSAQRFDDEDTAANMPLQNPFAFAKPEGWTELPPQNLGAIGLKLINLRFGPNGEGECALTLSAGASGGTEANVNRWRKQMGLPPMTPEEITKLPQRPILNREAVFVTLDGDFTAMGSPAPQKDYRLVGLINSSEKATMFVKMTGPRALVQQNQPAFDEFIKSLTLKLEP